jgi:hypothetical protein
LFVPAVMRDAVARSLDMAAVSASTLSRLVRMYRPGDADRRPSGEKGWAGERDTIASKWPRSKRRPSRRLSPSSLQPSSTELLVLAAEYASKSSDDPILGCDSLTRSDCTELLPYALEAERLDVRENFSR